MGRRSKCTASIMRTSQTTSNYARWMEETSVSRHAKQDTNMDSIPTIKHGKASHSSPQYRSPQSRLKPAPYVGTTINALLASALHDIYIAPRPITM